MEPQEFTHGMRYRVHFKHSNQRRTRTFVGTCMGYEGRHLWFDLRPGAGTMQLDADDVIDAQVVPRSVPHHNPKVEK